MKNLNTLSILCVSVFFLFPHFGNAQALEGKAVGVTINDSERPIRLRSTARQDSSVNFVIVVNDTYVVRRGTGSIETELDPNWIETVEVWKNQDDYPIPYQHLADGGIIIIGIKPEFESALPKSILEELIQQR